MTKQNGDPQDAESHQREKTDHTDFPVMQNNSTEQTPVSKKSETPKTAKTTGTSRKRQTSKNIYTFTVTLRYIKPAISRTIRVPGNRTLAQFHEILQSAFGWWNCHLHEFRFQNRNYGVPSHEDWEPVLDEKRYTLDSLALQKGNTLWYTYDFGDDWKHQCKVSKIEDSTPELDAYPVCLRARRAAPPEDCGGAPGYEHLLEVLEEPAESRTEDDEELIEWLPESYDPEHVDIDHINRMIKEL